MLYTRGLLLTRRPDFHFGAADASTEACRGTWEAHSEAAIQQMTCTQTGELLGKEGSGYGLGWSTGKRPYTATALGASGSFGHSGAYSTDMRIDMQHGLITVFMVQHAGYPGSDGGGEILPAFQKAAIEVFAQQ